MYPVSDAYKAAIQQKVRNVGLYGTITLKDNTTIQFDDSTVVQGSFYIAGQCVNGDELDIGSAYAAEMGMSLITDISDYHALDGAVIAPFFKLDIGGGVYESLPLGIWNVTDPKRKNTTVAIKSLCNMILLDVDIEGISTSAKPYDYLSWCCDRCGVELGMTRAEIEALPNGNILIGLPSDSEIQTCRDLVGWIAQLLCCFAYFGRDGKLMLKIPVGDPVSTINAEQRNSTAISDFSVNYTSVSASINGNILTKQLESNTGTELTLEENPLMRLGIKEVHEDMLLNILNSISNAKYTPFQIDWVGDPALDVGDYITLAGSGKIGLITHSTWHYRGKHTMKGVGKDPRLKVKQTQSQKKIDSTANAVGSLPNAVYYYENISQIQIGTEKSEIIDFSFATVAKANPAFHAELNFVITSAGVIEFSYLLDNAAYYVTPKHTVAAGNYIIHLFLPMVALKANQLHELRVFMKSDTAAGYIDKYQLVATVNGQGLATDSSNYNANIQLSSVIPAIAIAPKVTIAGFTAELTAPTLNTSTVIELSQAIPEVLISTGPIAIADFMTKVLTERVVTGEKFIFDLAHSSSYVYQSDYIDTVIDAFKLRESYIYVGAETTIDSGKMLEIDINTAQYKSVSAIVVGVGV